jgi:hypothetical protein
MYTVELNGHEARVEFNNGYEEFDLFVQFDYQPYERSTSTYPGASEAVEYYDCTRDGSYGDICLLGDTHEYIEEAILEAIHDCRQKQLDEYLIDNSREAFQARAGSFLGITIFSITLWFLIWR